MISFFKRILFLSIFCISSIAFQINAITVDVPGDDVVVRDGNIPSSTIDGDSESIIKLIQQINQYLRFSIGVICLAVVLYAGFKILMAQGDKDKLKKANETLTGAIVGIFIAIFSYVLVRLVVNLF